MSTLATSPAAVPVHEDEPAVHITLNRPTSATRWASSSCGDRAAACSVRGTQQRRSGCWHPCRSSRIRRHVRSGGMLRDAAYWSGHCP